MNEDSIASYTWMCPACGRRVPKRVDTCRCGQVRPDSAPAPAPEPPSRSEPRRAAVLGTLVVVLLAAVVGWYLYAKPGFVGNSSFGSSAPATGAGPIPAEVRAVPTTTNPESAPSDRGGPTSMLAPALPNEQPAQAPPAALAPSPSAASAQVPVEDRIGRVIKAVVGVKGDGRI